MNYRTYITAIFTFFIYFTALAKDKLITIYDKDCGFSQELLNKTYQNDLVKKKLSKYEHLIFEADTEEGRNYINKFNITAYPLQIIENDRESILIEGYYEPNKQLNILNNPIEFKNQLINTALLQEQDDFLPLMVIKYLCTTMNNANSSSKSSLEAFMTALASMTTKMKIEIDDYNKYTFENIDKLVCKNKSIIQMREHNTLLKYAIDSANYEFIREAIFIKVNGKNVCNPYIDFNRVEIIDGEEETLIQFIDKLLNEDGMDAAHDFNGIRNIKLELTGCSERQHLFETHELNKLPENELKQIRLKQSYFYKSSKYSQIFYYSIKDKIYKYGLIDRTGALVIPFEYENMGNGIYENLIYVSKNNKIGFVNTSNKIIIPFEYDNVERGFFEGLAGVEKNGKWGFINKSNETVIPFQFDDLDYNEGVFRNGRVKVSKNKKKFYIDNTGKCVEDCE